MHISVSFDGAAADIELGVDDPRACIGDLTAGLDGAAADALGLLVDGRWFGPDIGLDEVGLYDGAVVEIAPRPATFGRSPVLSAPERPNVAWEARTLAVAVVGGPAAGRSFPITGERAVIGRDPACDIVLDDPAVSHRHATISASATITDLGSTNGTWIDDTPVTVPTRVPDAALVRVGATHLRVRVTNEDDRPVGLDVGGVVSFNRPPRPAPPPAFEPLVAPAAPKASAASRAFGIAMIAGPILMAAGMVVMFGDLRFALFAAFAPVTALVSWLASKRTARTERRRHHRAFAAALDEFRLDLAARAVDERLRRDEQLTDVAEVVRRATLPSVKLWERRPPDGDFLRLRAGIGRAPWSPAVPSGREPPPPEVVALLEEHRRLANAPVEIDLSAGGVVGIVGERSMALALARSLVVQAAVHHGPADLGIAVFGADEWDWAKWLPHLDEAPAGEAEDGRTVLAVVDDVASIKGRHAPVRQLLHRQSGVVIAATEDQLPSMCTTIVSIRSDLGEAELRRPQDRLHLDELLVTGIDDATARECARSLARFEDPEVELAGAGLPDTVRLLPLLGLDDPTPAAITEAWQHDEADPPPATPIGIAAEGVVHVDLVRDGPHGLVGGTTGSGKSELLRSLVAGMAARVDPEHLVFVLVDYKGGSAFDECRRLPHVVGVVTDLDEQLAERALRSLEAELRHRERTLRDAGAVDLPGYLRAGSIRGPLPRLVVVIDEFATMAAELPDFLGALVGIAQRGRSLGVHLVLATQRPSGAVNANIKANTNLRIAFRVQDGADSCDIIDRPDASAIGRATPGRAYLRRGPTDVVLAHTALATSARSARGNARLTVREFRRCRYQAPDVHGGGGEGPTELTALVDAICGAFDGREPPRRPWLPMLPEHIELSDILSSHELGVISGAMTALTTPSSEGVVAFAVADEPDRQRRAPAGWVPADGHLALFGMVGSGTTTAMLSVVEAVARTWTADECHVYAIDYGANSLRPLEQLPHVGAVITASEREAQARLLRLLRTEVDRRRATGDTRPRIVLCIDDVGAFLADHDGIDGSELSDAFRRVFSEGHAVGINCIVTADRVGALPVRLASLVSQKLLFRLADVSDYSTLGLRAAELPRFVPGRAVHSDGNRVVQVGLPGDLGALAAPRVAPPIGTLPTEVSFATLPAARLETPCRLPLGIGDDDLEVAWLTVHDGEHILIAGPPRSGKTNALALLAHTIRAEDKRALLLGICEPRSRLHTTDAFDATGSLDEVRHHLRAAMTDERRCFVLVDDAPTVHDADGLLAATLRSNRPDVHVVAAGRADDVRAAYGHWVRIVRQSRTGVLLQPDLAADGDLLGVRLPRRLTVPLVPGRGFAVDGGQAALIQLASI